MATEARHAGEFIVSEGNGVISRDTITIASGQVLPAGAVLGKVTASGLYAAYNNAATDGTEVAAAILYDAVDATAGNKRAVAITRLAEVDAKALTGLDADAVADLAAQQIIVR